MKSLLMVNSDRYYKNIRPAFRLSDFYIEMQLGANVSPTNLLWSRFPTHFFLPTSHQYYPNLKPVAIHSFPRNILSGTILSVHEHDF